MAGRERAMFFVIVKPERTADEKRCADHGVSATSRVRRAAQRRIRRGSSSRAIWFAVGRSARPLGQICFKVTHFQPLRAKMTLILRFRVTCVTNSSSPRNLDVVNAAA
ncbi:hypothetical protein [Sphingopyxis sp.]|uniref:hypothetical protein n=1 Tax=Sphingopyxis sp. TaxID=1908224 RepID=UPI003D0AD465